MKTCQTLVLISGIFGVVVVPAMLFTFAVGFLKKRYAKGKTSKEEYGVMREVLQ